MIDQQTLSGSTPTAASIPFWCATLLAVFGSVNILVPLYLVAARMNYPSTGATGPPVFPEIDELDTPETVRKRTAARPEVLNSPDEPIRGGSRFYG